jgi:predicted component of type VI protein secretion system
VPEPLLAILKLCTLALLYLFFFRVLRAVWAEVAPVRTAAPAPAAGRSRPPRRSTSRRARDGDSLVVVEPREQKGQRYALGEEVTVGRAAGCTVTIDDNYASQLHARLFRRDGSIHVEDLGSTNGTYLNGRKLTGSQPVKRGDRVKIGATVFEVDG